jgi:hypothetical protein
MSYFMMISGDIPDSPANGEVEFIPAASAQDYIARLESELVQLDGGPLYLVHDRESGTSDSIVSALESALLREEGTSGLPLTEILQACFAQGTSFRIWLATNDPMAHINNSFGVRDLATARAALQARRGAWWHAPANKSYMDSPQSSRN